MSNAIIAIFDLAQQQRGGLPPPERGHVVAIANGCKIGHHAKRYLTALFGVALHTRSMLLARTLLWGGGDPVKEGGMGEVDLHFYRRKMFTWRIMENCHVADHVVRRSSRPAVIVSRWE
jgi:hypothetical protein